MTTLMTKTSRSYNQAQLKLLCDKVCDNIDNIQKVIPDVGATNVEVSTTRNMDFPTAIPTMQIQPFSYRPRRPVRQNYEYLPKRRVTNEEINRINLEKQERESRQIRRTVQPMPIEEEKHYDETQDSKRRRLGGKKITNKLKNKKRKTKKRTKSKKKTRKHKR